MKRIESSVKSIPIDDNSKRKPNSSDEESYAIDINKVVVTDTPHDGKTSHKQNNDKKFMNKEDLKEIVESEESKKRKKDRKSQKKCEDYDFVDLRENIVYGRVGGSYSAPIKARLPPVNIVYESIRVDMFREKYQKKKKNLKQKEKELESKIKEYVHSQVSSSDEEDESEKNDYRDPQSAFSFLEDQGKHKFQATYPVNSKSQLSEYENILFETDNISQEVENSLDVHSFVSGFTTKDLRKKLRRKVSYAEKEPVITVSGENMNEHFRSESVASYFQKQKEKLTSSILSSKNEKPKPSSLVLPYLTKRKRKRTDHEEKKNGEEFSNHQLNTSDISNDKSKQKLKQERKLFQMRLKRQEFLCQRLHNESNLPNYKQIAMRSSFNHRRNGNIELCETSEYWDEYLRKYKNKAKDKRMVLLRSVGASTSNLEEKKEKLPRLVIIRDKVGGFESVLENDEE